MTHNRKQTGKPISRAVVKVGSNVLTTQSGLNIEAIDGISSQICNLLDQGIEIILVSSGAMASGMKKMGVARRPEAIPKRQAIAAVGQAGLIREWEKAFSRFDRRVAQILLTSDDLTSRKRYLNARNTMNTLLEWQVVPIINENDTIMVEEIKLGDNDNLAAMIALQLDADIFINLTDIDGLYDKDPRIHADARLIPQVATYSKSIEKYAGDIPGALGTGGMLSKIKAARKVTAAGIPMVIAKGYRSDILIRLAAGEAHGTFFVPRDQKLNRKKCWIGYTVKTSGTIKIDAGAAKALLANGKSLLPGGIVGVEGKFPIGAPVAVVNGSGELIGNGLVNYNADEIRSIMGLKSGQIKARLGQKTYDEVIHRDNLVITGEPENE
ncbi:glutamate 5-kinase [Desulfosarcina ovata subsp. sediminis]|uniref:Glutamate 5-kinase n=1 Tax=Desulfosarcina ovata subsp. sediminis TaxID=885957 RepID=A0A5K7ZWH3_9BACT|nr:glutamate 5-kinase [Desulfosarcina ovata]BBO84617.1 glutamate 5-kinase [Desulfosarcina ovata subsp. sediminis]